MSGLSRTVEVEDYCYDCFVSRVGEGRQERFYSEVEVVVKCNQQFSEEHSSSDIDRSIISSYCTFCHSIQNMQRHLKISPIANTGCSKMSCQK